MIFLNENNVVKPPISLTMDRVKSEFTALRRQNKSIQIGICRCSDRSLFNNTTIQHLGSLTFHEFENLSHNEQFNENPKSSSIVNNESKKFLNLFSNKKKKSPAIQKQKSSLNRNSAFIEIDGKYITESFININLFLLIDQSLISNSNKHRSKRSTEENEAGNSMTTQKSFDSSQQSPKKPVDASINRVTTQTHKESNGM